MATYYFATAGDDVTGNGSLATPWKTITKANATSKAPGDSFLFKGGDTFNDAVLAISTSGTSGNRITFGSYGTGKATLSCGSVRAIYLQNAEYITIQDFIITGDGVVAATGLMVGGSTNHLYAIDCESSLTSGSLKSLQLLRCVISGVWGGVWIHSTAASTPVGWDGIEIGGTATDPFIVHDVIHVCIWFWGSTAAGHSHYPYYIPAQRIHSHVHVHHWKTYNAYGRFAADYTLPTSPADDVNPPVGHEYNFTGFGIYAGNMGGTAYNDNIFEYGEGHHCGQNNSDPRGGAGVIMPIEADYVTIQWVEAHHAQRTAVDGVGIDFDGGSTFGIVQYCYAHHNMSFGIMTGSFSGNSTTPHDIICRFNITEKNGNGAFGTFNSFANNVTIERNTFYEEGLASSGSLSVILCPNSTQTWTIRNNILITNDAGNFINYYGFANQTIQGNLYHSTAGTPRWQNVGHEGIVSTIAAWRASTSTPESGAGLNSNPLLRSVGTAGTIADLAQMNSLVTAYNPTSTSPGNSGGLSSVQSGLVDFHNNVPVTGTATGALEYVQVIAGPVFSIIKSS